MSNTISEGEIMIKDELPEVEPIKTLNLRPRKPKPIKIKQKTKVAKKVEEVVVKIAEDKVERFEICTLDPLDEIKVKLESPKQKISIIVPTVPQTKAIPRKPPNPQIGRTYICKLCVKVFKDSTSLRQHSFTHKETRDFHCDLCDKSFKTSSNLKQHKYGHVEEKAFACSICHKAFRKKAVMRRHQMGHTEERPFACLVCDSSFKFKDQLQVHQKNYCKDIPSVK
jgi:hypothetical protein